jgi:hypothetical protein
LAHSSPARTASFGAYLEPRPERNQRWLVIIRLALDEWTAIAASQQCVKRAEYLGLALRQARLGRSNCDRELGPEGGANRQQLMQPHGI